MRETEDKSGEILRKLNERVASWFISKYGTLSEAQVAAVPHILAGKNVLVCAPTGSGKTLSAFLAILSKLADLRDNGKLENCVYCVYISPLKAVANDIRKNLLTPLEEMKLADEIRVSVRTGDTPQKEKHAMLKLSPHILITTPESFTILLNSRRFAENLKHVEYVIIDEIHDICGTKRGMLLSAELEFLREISKNFVRIGLSATQSPIETIARFLGGFSGTKPRNVQVVNLDTYKDYDLSIILPPGIENMGVRDANMQIAQVCASIIREHRTVLIFTNTRRLTEELVNILRGMGVVAIDAHHGSMSRKRRLETEDALKKGELRAVVTSTSLELGIDVGSIDCVIQISSPKSISKAIQRFGRSGHTLTGRAKGIIVATSVPDFIEGVAIIENIKARNIDRVEIPENGLDVLAQVVVGAGINTTWEVKKILKILKNSYAYHRLRKSQLTQVLKMLSEGRNARLNYEPKLEEYTAKKSAMWCFYENVGTIPHENNYTVYDEYGDNIGTLSERFAEFLKTGDTFLLGARVYEFIRRTGNKIFVRESAQKNATIPSWLGEMNARSKELSASLSVLFDRLSKMSAGELSAYFSAYCSDQESVREVVQFIERQKGTAFPGMDKIVVETISDNDKIATIVLSIYGRRVNESIARYIVSKLDVHSDVLVDDNGFSIVCQEKIPLKSILSTGDFTEVLEKNVRNSEIFESRLKQCAMRAMLVLKHYGGKKVQTRSISKAIQHLIENIDRKHPIYQEALKETLSIALHVEEASGVIERIKNGKINIMENEGTLSPLAQALLVGLAKDIGFYADKLKRLRDFAGAKKYIVEPDAIKIQFKSVDEGFEFLRKFHTYWFYDDILESLVSTGKIYKLNDTSAYLFPDVYAMYTQERGNTGRKQHLRKLIEYFATKPMSEAEFRELLNIDAQELREFIEELVAEGKLALVEYNGEDKYLAAAFLQYVLAKNSELISQEDVEAYILNATFDVSSIEECFERWIGISDPYVLFVRGLYSKEKWDALVKQDLVVHGRFLGGRTRFVMKKDLGLLQSVYRVNLSENEKIVWNLLSQPLSFSELRKMTKIPARRLREIVDKLESAVLVRKVDGENTRYVKIEKIEHEGDTDAQIMLRLIKGLGAVSVDLLSRYLNIPWERVDAVLNNLFTRGLIRRAQIIGSERTVFYIESAKNAQRKAGGLLIMSDPYLVHRWAQIAGKIGDAYSMVHIIDGSITGFVSVDNKDACIEVYGIQIDEENLHKVPDICSALVKLLDYSDKALVRIKQIAGVPARQHIGMCKGWVQCGDAIVYPVVPFHTEVFSFTDVFGKFLFLQGIHRRFENTLEVIEKCFGIGEEYESIIRAKYHVNPAELKNVYLASGIPPQNTYHTLEQLCLAKKIKNYRIDEETRDFLKVIESKLSMDELYSRIPLSYRKFCKWLRTMLRMNVLYEDNGRIGVVPDINITREEAITNYITQLMERFGIGNASMIASYTKNIISKEEAEKVLRNLTASGFCVTGFFIKELDELFYAIKSLPNCANSEYTGVIPPDDCMVRYYAGIILKISGFSLPYLIVKNGRLTGFVKARKKKKEIHVSDFAGSEQAWNIFLEYLYSNDFVLRYDKVYRKLFQ